MAEALLGALPPDVFAVLHHLHRALIAINHGAHQPPDHVHVRVHVRMWSSTTCPRKSKEGAGAWTCEALARD